MFVLHEPTFDGLLSAFAWCLRRREPHPVFFATLPQQRKLDVSPACLQILFLSATPAAFCAGGLVKGCSIKLLLEVSIKKPQQKLGLMF